MNGAVAFNEAIRIETGALELAIDIAGKHKTAVWHGAGPLLQCRKTGVRHGVAVQLQAVTINSPGQLRIVSEGLRVGNLSKVQPRPAQGRVGLPHAFIATEIG